MSEKKVLTALTILAVCGYLLSAAFIILGIYMTLFKVEENHCEMTYMYQMPQFHPLPLPLKVVHKYIRYTTTIYREADDTRHIASLIKNRKLSGHPVLFIPGSGGSHKQVRSLASVALQKSYSSNIKFDFFAIDFDDEWSALMGNLLYRQLNYTMHAVRYISRLYSEQSHVTELIVYGHSMGGVVAMALVNLLRNKQDGSFLPIKLVLTYASPLSQPVVMFDPLISEFYSQYLKTSNKNTTYLSIAGGDRDILIEPRFIIPSLTAYRAGSFVLGNTMIQPLVWASTDHQCIVWCRQVVLQSARALFEYKLLDVNNHVAREDLLMKRFMARQFRSYNLMSADHVTLPEYPSNQIEYTFDDMRYHVANVLEFKPQIVHLAKIVVPEIILSGPVTHMTITLVHNLPFGELIVKFRSNRAIPTPYASFDLAEKSFPIPPASSHNQVFRVETSNVEELYLKFNEPNESKNKFARGSKPIVAITFESTAVVTKQEDIIYSGTSFVSWLHGILSPMLFTTSEVEPVRRLMTRASQLSILSEMVILTPNCQKSTVYPINGTVAIVSSGGLPNVDGKTFFAPHGKPLIVPLTSQLLPAFTSGGSYAAESDDNHPIANVLLVKDPSCTYELSVASSVRETARGCARVVLLQLPRLLGAVLMIAMGMLMVIIVPTEDDPGANLASDDADDDSIRAGASLPTMAFHCDVMMLAPVIIVVIWYLQDFLAIVSGGQTPDLDVWLSVDSIVNMFGLCFTVVIVYVLFFCVDTLILKNIARFYTWMNPSGFILFLSAVLLSGVGFAIIFMGLYATSFLLFTGVSWIFAVKCYQMQSLRYVRNMSAVSALLLSWVAAMRIVAVMSELKDVVASPPMELYVYGGRRSYGYLSTTLGPFGVAILDGVTVWAFAAATAGFARARKRLASIGDLLAIGWAVTGLCSASLTHVAAADVVVIWRVTWLASIALSGGLSIGILMDWVDFGSSKTVQPRNDKKRR